MDEGQVIAFKAKDGSLHEEKLDYQIRNLEIELDEVVLAVGNNMPLPHYGRLGNGAYDANDFFPLLKNALEKDHMLVAKMASMCQDLKALKEIREERKQEKHAG
ncbi:MAG: hypothetical protein ABWX90_02525 [Candidatus Saccharimonadales bacterium]